MQCLKVDVFIGLQTKLFFENLCVSLWQGAVQTKRQPLSTSRLNPKKLLLRIR